ncbi:unnamed protein product [Scytosiphon promiscuus]
MPVCGIPCRLSLKHHSPEVFGSSRLLPQKPYVFLRACLALNSLYWLIRSMSVFGNRNWLLYLTHWTFALQTVYYFLALGSAVHLWVNSGRRRSTSGLWSSREIGGGVAATAGAGGDGDRVAGAGGDVEKIRPKIANYTWDMTSTIQSTRGPKHRISFTKIKRPKTLVKTKASRSLYSSSAACNMIWQAMERWRKLQWGLLIACADSAIIVTGVYWAFLYNGWSDQLNLQIHLFNTLFMMTNVFLGGTPFKWEHIGISYIYGFLYLAFDILYYISGYTFSAREDTRVIYFFLDWGQRPGQAVTTTIFLLAVGLPLSHGLYVLVASARDRLRRIRPDWGWQGTDEEELERAMEVSGLRDADVWAPLTAEEGFDSEEEEMGGATVFHNYTHNRNTDAAPSGKAEQKAVVLKK